MRQNDPSLVCSPLKDERIGLTEQSHLVNADDIYFIGSPANSPHDTIIEIFVREEFRHLLGLGKKALADALRIKSGLDLQTEFFGLCSAFG